MRREKVQRERDKGKRPEKVMKVWGGTGEDEGGGREVGR